MRRPTLKTIASEMNLSVSAVSRIINGKGQSIGLSESTIKSTMAFADRIGYRPHKQAQSLRLGKTNTIGVMLFMPDCFNCDLAYKLFKGISHEAQQKSQALMFFDVSGKDSYINAIDKCLNSRVDGIIATHLDNDAYLKRLEEVIAGGVNVVMVLNPEKDSFPCPNVGVDEEKGGFMATEYLIKKGYKRIAHLCKRGHSSSGEKRLIGYKKALKRYKIAFEEELLVNDTEEAGFVGAKKLLQLAQPPEAVFCWNDKSAAAAQKIFKKAGVKIEIIGFDNRAFINYLDEPFTSIDLPLLEVGAKAVETLLSGDSSRRELAVAPSICMR